MVRTAIEIFLRPDRGPTPHLHQVEKRVPTRRMCNRESKEILRKRFLKYTKFATFKSTRRISHREEHCQEEINRKIEPATHPSINHDFTGICPSVCVRSGTSYFRESSDIRSAPPTARIQPSLFHPRPQLGKPFPEESAELGFSD